MISLSLPAIVVIKHPWEAPGMWNWKEQLESVPGVKKNKEKSPFF